MTDIDTRPELPDIFPQTNVTVSGEKHRYTVSQTNNGPEPKLDYLLDKAPVEVVQSIQGTDQDGTSRTFNNGVDYELTALDDTVSEQFEYEVEQEDYLLRYDPIQGSTTVTDSDNVTYIEGDDYQIVDSDEHFGDSLEWTENGDDPTDTQLFTVEYDISIDNCVISWQTDGANLPQAGSEFFVTYRAESIISRYLDANESELERVEQQFEEIINNKFVDQASGEALDELGKLFGPVIGKRRGRTDTQYRIYLKSVVQSFISRGTVEGIKLAISAATEVPIDDITINENFENVEYEVELIPDTPITIELLENVAEIADPSGVNQLLTRIIVDPDESLSNDSTKIKPGIEVDDVAISGDNIVIDPNKFSAGTDTATVSDTLATNSNTTDTTETATSTEKSVLSESVDKNSHRWEKTTNSDVESEWSFFEWTEIVDEQQSASDLFASADSATFTINTAEISETALTDDAVETPQSEGNTVDTVAVTDDAVETPQSEGNTVDTGATNDTVSTISSTLVAWNTNSWESFDWAREHS